MQIRRVTALIDTDGRDISGNRVNMAKNTSHLISEVDMEYFLSRPLIFVVSGDVDIATIAFDTLGNAIGVTLPDGGVILFGMTTAQTTTFVNAQISSAVIPLQTVNNSQNILISALQAAVAALQSGVPTVSVSSISSPTASEGANLVFTIYLSSATQQAQNFPLVIGGTATAGSDYSALFTYSSGVTLSNGVLSIPAGVSSFTATTLTATDALAEPTETVTFTLNGIVGTGSIINVTAGSVVWDGGSTTWDGGSTAWIN